MTLLLLSFQLLAAVAIGACATHRLVLLCMTWMHRRNTVPTPPALGDARAPTVLVQMPVYDERDVVARLLTAVAALDWPRDRLHLQLLDDSDDDTPAIAAPIVARLAAEGHDITHLRRGSRAGFKAGALTHGLQADAGRAGGPAEYVAILDADFVPEPSFLRHALPPLLDDPRVGLVQARWTHLNREASLLCRAQAGLLDGHFLLEHGARARAGRFFNFNGTAGVWRRAAIDDAGGWSGDTLCEDLDLSYRAQLAGWRFVFLPGLTVPAELPADAAAFKSQQHRWAKGSIQVARKLLGPIWRAPVSLGVKLEATFHLGSGLTWLVLLPLLLIYPLGVLAQALALTGATDAGHPGASAGALDPLVLAAALSSTLLFYGVAALMAPERGRLARLLALPLVFAAAIGLAFNNTRAVLSGLRGEVSPFVRTPKAGTHGKTSYASRGDVAAPFECLTGLLLAVAAVMALSAGRPWSAALAALPAAGLLRLGLGSLRRPRLRRRPRPGARPRVSTTPTTRTAGRRPPEPPTPAPPRALPPPREPTPGTTTAAVR